MKAVILAAGYSTRLFPQGSGMPKCMVEVDNRHKGLIDYILEQLINADAIDDITIVTNAKFYEPMKKWLEEKPKSKKVELLNDGTVSNETRLGAIRDMEIALKGYKGDAIVLASDFFVPCDIDELIAYAMEKNGSANVILPHTTLEELKAGGSLDMDENGKIIDFKEKSPEPYKFYGTPIYMFRKKDASLIKPYLKEGNKPDAPGFFLEWLCKRATVFGFVHEGEYYHLTDQASLEDIRKRLKR